MLHKFNVARTEYPRQFWLMFYGMLLSTAGASMIWPFLTIYVSERLKLPLAAVASLLTVQSVMGLLSSLVAGPLIDRIGRKWMMVLSLGLNALGYLLLSQAHTFPAFAVLLALQGAVNPLYRVGADAMMADLVSPEKRADAFSLIRMSNNLGVAVGPAIGGIAAAASYNLAFYVAFAGMGGYSLLLAVFAAETLPQRHPDAPRPPRERFGGYGEVFRDHAFVTFAGAFTLIQVCAMLIWSLMAVYAKHNFGVPESQYGLIPTTNGLMVVLFQVAVTGVTKRYPTLRVMAIGSLVYTVAVGGVALATGFGGFWLVMVVMTVGELMLMPTSSAYAANLAPADKRGRYMSLYGLTWGIASGIAPVLGGVLNDNLGPRAPWLAGALIGLVGVLGFAWLAQRAAARAETIEESPI